MEYTRILMGKESRLGTVYPESVRRELNLSEPVTREDIISNLEQYKNTEFIFSTWGMPQFGTDEIKTLFPSLRAVFYAAGSVQSFARPFLECGVDVFSAWEANDIPVAEFTVSEIILANKGFFASERTFRESRSKRTASAYAAARPGNYHSTVGIIGCGMVGSMVARRLARYNLDLLAYDPYMSEDKAVALGVRQVSLEDLFSQCDTVTNHVANNKATVGMLTGELFASMKPNAVFINTGRGQQIREDEFIEVLHRRTDITALLDVTYPEPPDADSALYTLPNVWLTPHIAGSMNGECVRMAEWMRDEFNRYISGEPTSSRVTLKMLQTMA